jgi:hypothetical protein
VKGREMETLLVFGLVGMCRSRGSAHVGCDVGNDRIKICVRDGQCSE